MFAIDGCKLPSNASKEWSGTIEDLKKKRDKMEKYIERIIKQHRELDKDEKAKKIQKPYAKTMGKDKDRRERSIARLEKKLKKLNKFLKDAEPRKRHRQVPDTQIAGSLRVPSSQPQNRRIPPERYATVWGVCQRQKYYMLIL